MRAAVADAPHGGRFDAIVERLHRLHPRQIDLSLHRLQHLLDRLGNPERRLPPTLHVAGTNGKGSVCAFLRAFGEAAGLRAHVYTSPHLVRFNERIALAGREVDDATLADVLEELERANEAAAITVFEVITAAALLLFARQPADFCVIEVGLGGRLDATNVIPPPRAGAITSISIDHREWLGETLADIATEKAGIIKPGMPVATGAQAPEVLALLATTAARAGATLLARGHDWTIARRGEGLRFEDPAGALDLPLPALPGSHQIDNAGIALAAIRAAGLGLPPAALGDGLARARWPARLQRLHGALAARLPPEWELWLDGGHNAAAGAALGEHAASWDDRPLHVIVGMKRSKDAQGFLRPLLARATTLWAVAEPGQHLAQPVDEIIAASGGVAHAGPTVVAALDALPRAPGPARVLVCGSLYLAGEVLKADAG
ncbi:MAG: bifunctional folylpolyglutamate synthase/dihydrofolate synthase [Alphaproteobacteria bacterium]|nr:bifunctional folylpolyglutamate synthase/dihydrofolate synthase [Alphaproteobacteria bacterium]